MSIKFTINLVIERVAIVTKSCRSKYYFEVCLNWRVETFHTCTGYEEISIAHCSTMTRYSSISHVWKKEKKKRERKKKRTE